MKKFLALVLALMMVMSLATVAFADGEGSDCYIQVPENSTHTYVAYQIFTGDLHEQVLSTIVWGNGVDESYYKTDDTVTKVAADIADTLKNAADALAFADTLAEIDTETGNFKYLQNKIEFEDGIAHVTPGYYLIMDETVPAHHAYTRYIMRVVGTVEFEPKEGWPSSDKLQTLTPDDETTYLHREVDVNIGDTISYKVTGTIPTEFDYYKTYKYIFHDTMAASLTFNKDVVVKLVHHNAGAADDIFDITDAFTTSELTPVYDESEPPVVIANEFTIGCDDIKAITGHAIHSGDEIHAYYTATLNDKAIIGNPGQKNTSYLEFSNNPNPGGEGSTGDTPPVSVYAFTFELDINKEDGIGTALEGAEFKLKRSDTEWAKVDENGKFVEWVAQESSATALTTAIVEKDDGSKKAVASVAGLDAGTYYLKETKAPLGFDKLNHEIKVEIVPTYSDKFDAITFLNVTVTHGNNNSTTTPGGIDTGAVTVKVINTPGNTLPTTGGIGTTLFYVIGSVLMVGAAVLLIVKKRMNNM